MRSRRDFLKMAAAGAAMTSPAIQRALAIGPDRRTGTIQDVQHVVILMQENRSFDHYFGTMRGVRGFSDPHPAVLPGGRSVWHQPVAQVKTKHYKDRGLHPQAEFVLPFYLNPRHTTEFQAGTNHGWSSGHLAWNDGHYDQWVNQKQDALTMGYLKREDLGFHYALAESFTLCDAYFCSVHGDTCPNRICLWSGTIDPANRMGRRPNGPGIEERSGTNGYTWTTYPERLQAAGISWQVYQGGTGIPGTPTDNYTDNSLEFFAQYQVKEGAEPGSPLVRRGVTDRTLAQFREDVGRGQLPQVSWIVAPYKYCEHPEASPTDGAYFLSMVLDALTSNPDLWSRTAFLINYDENDGLFDHVVPPMPPHTLHQGGSGMVSASLAPSLCDEFLDLDRFPHEKNPLIPGADPGGLQPVGLGPRVPLFVVSPWSTGGYTCSEVFDHTSVLRFLERRFGVEEPNISAWRRSVCGDLTSAFDFSQSGTRRTTSYPPPQPITSLHRPYSIPAEQSMPTQEPGTRPARPLGYAVNTHSRVEHDRVWLDLQNHGTLGAAFYVYDRTSPQTPPRRYTVAAGDTLSDFWSAKAGDAYDLIVHGPNGSYARHAGVAGIADRTVHVELSRSELALTLRLTNATERELAFVWSDKLQGAAGGRLVVPAGGEATEKVPLAETFGWYDLTLTDVSGSGAFHRQVAGRVENGRPGRTSPHTERADGSQAGQQPATSS